MGRERFFMTIIFVNYLVVYESVIYYVSEEYEEGEAILYRVRVFGSGGMSRILGVKRMTVRIYVFFNCIN